MKPERWWWILICAFAAAVGLSTFWLPAPLPVDAPPTSFSAARALEHVKAIAQAPHPTGSRENVRVREYVLARMRELGLKPREMIGELNDLKAVNLYGELEGMQPSTPPVLLVAHCDSTPRGPGAADDASGVATILETIRALKAGGPLRNTLGVLITDGEELPGVLLGSNTFVRDHPDLVKGLRLVVNLEARGNHGPVLMFETGRDNRGRIGFFGQACPLPVAGSFSEEIYRRMPNDTDFTEFLRAGKRGFNFGFVGGIEYYHTPQDTPDNLNLRTLQHYGECVLPLAAHLGQANNEALGQCSKPGDATFFTLWRGLLVHYPSWLARTLAWATAGLFVFALVKGLWRSALRFRFIVMSVTVNLIAVVLATAVGAGAVFGLVRHFKPRQFGPFVVGLPHEGGFLAGTLLVAIAITLVLRVWLLRRANTSEGLAGALVVWVALALTANALLPGASYLFVWPALFGTIALLLSDRRGERRGGRALLLNLLAGAPAPLLLAPTILLLLQAITIGIAPVASALVALAVCLMPFGRSPSRPADEQPRVGTEEQGAGPAGVPAT